MDDKRYIFNSLCRGYSDITVLKNKKYEQNYEHDMKHNRATLNV